MRLGVLDVGSNTVHLLLVDAHRGAHPWPAHSEKAVLRLAEQIGPDGALTKAGADALVKAAPRPREGGRARAAGRRPAGVRDLRGAGRHQLRRGAGPGAQGDRRRLQVLSGDDEARLTFLAVRRWFGWSAGRLLVLDIGGGSLEIAAGIDETPDLAMSLPLGAGRLTRERLGVDRDTASPPSPSRRRASRSTWTRQLDPAVDEAGRVDWDRAVATSKTFRTLARLAGAAPSRPGCGQPRVCSPAPACARCSASSGTSRRRSSSELEGVSAGRAHQLLAGAVVAEAAMRRLGIEQVDICPWALREGVILRRSTNWNRH